MSKSGRDLVERGKVLEALQAQHDSVSSPGVDTRVIWSRASIQDAMTIVRSFPAWEPDVEAAFDADYKHCIASADVRVRAILRAAGCEVGDERQQGGV